MNSKTINWKVFEDYNLLDARQRPEVIKSMGVNDSELINLLSKSHIVIPGKTRFECQKCGECCRYARKISQFNYDPCPFLTAGNTCSKHDTRYAVCKWFPFFVYTHPKLGEVLTIKPYCSGYGKGPLVDYGSTVRKIKTLQQLPKSESDGAFVIHEVLYLPEKKEWVFPSRQNVDKLLSFIAKATNQKTQTNVYHEGELHYAHHYTSGLLGAVSEPQATIDFNGEITDLNPAFAQVCKQSREALLGLKFSQLFLNPESVEAKLEVCFNKGKTTGSPQQIKIQDDKNSHVLLNAMAYRNRNDGLIHSILVCLNEVTPHMYNEVVNSKDYARSLIEASIDMFVALDPEGYITDLNEACCAMVGAKREDIIGSRFKDYFDNPSLVDYGIQKTYKEGKVKDYELNLIDKAGKVHPVSFNASVYKGSDGAVLGIMAVARDISHVKSLIQDLEAAHEYARGLIESSIDMMVCIDPQGNVTDVNEATEKITGFGREELTGSQFIKYFKNSTLAEAGIVSTLKNKYLRNYKLQLKTKSGKTPWVSFNASLFTGPDNKMKIFAIARILDIEA